MEFECRICGCTEKPCRRDTYYYCANCGVCFHKPEMFTTEDDEDLELGLDEVEDSIEEEESEYNGSITDPIYIDNTE